MANEIIAFIGGGNMTLAIAGGLLEAGYAADKLLIAEPNSEQRTQLGKSLPGVQLSDNNDHVAAIANTVILAVKPQVLAGVCRSLSTVIKAHRPLIVSIAAGPRTADIDSWLGGGNAIVRVMPNQPALIGKGVSGLFANPPTTSAQRDTASSILSAVGPVVVVDNEAAIDAVTAVSGSGPAYFYLLIDMMTQAGTQLGLDASAAHELALETAVGATALAKASGDNMETLIARVRSPGGTTAAALDSLFDNGVRDIFQAALAAARDRATELADAAERDQ